MAFGLSQNWKVESAGGSTGNAFVGIHTGKDKIFLKRNTSPFLAALSAEGITPKLLWTKRLSNGDVITAQEWINGWTLTKTEMASDATAQLLAKVHSSNLLKNMLEKIGGSFVTPDQMLQQLTQQIQNQVEIQGAISAGLHWLELHTLQIPVSSYRVCHGDLNKKNWLKTKTGALYLVDWDQAMLADPIYDLTTVLMSYIPFKNWGQWLEKYGLKLDEFLMQRIQWYAILQQINDISLAYTQTQQTEATQIKKLNTLINEKK
ncbi:phosphotransferase [Agrilactobacillus yilanensis]|uniref:Phosphotransferase n=1 Tax=Agrilactobacillus yilanensis TaxID=2485997 RepID=A0ABW4JBB8_9LACO|nr:phosphotransferase family protein [Agrilactobacillus yilanensis]